MTRDSETITVSSTPIGITSSLLRNADGSLQFIRKATFSVESSPIRMTTTGTNPSNGSYTGLVIPAGTVFVLEGIEDIVNLKMIKSDAGDATVYVELA